jgi:hypothetical protein
VDVINRFALAIVGNELELRLRSGNSHCGSEYHRPSGARRKGVELRSIGQPRAAVLTYTSGFARLDYRDGSPQESFRIAESSGKA